MPRDFVTPLQRINTIIRLPLTSLFPPVISTVYISDLIQPAPVHRMEKQFRGRRCSPLGQYLVQARVSVDRGARCFSLDRWRRCWRTRRTRMTRLRTTTRRRRLRLRRRTTTRRPLINCVITVTKLWLVLASALQPPLASLSIIAARDLNCRVRNSADQERHPEQPSKIQLKLQATRQQASMFC